MYLLCWIAPDPRSGSELQVDMDVLNQMRDHDLKEMGIPMVCLT